jgi:hypothetical protein
MQRSKPQTSDMKRHPAVARDTMEDIKELGPTAGYREVNRDRALGETDRTGRHFDEAIEAPESPESE